MSFEDDIELPKVGRVIDCWCVQKHIASGPFSDVFIVADLNNRERKFAMKVEKQHGNLRAVLQFDVVILRAMTASETVGFPRMMAAGRTTAYKYVVMELLGPDLGKLRRTLPLKKFSSSTALRVLLQTLDRLETLHVMGWISRDVKAPNFAIGSEIHDDIIYMLDFGFAKKFRDEDGQYVKPRERSALVGTFQYAPLSAHRNMDQAPRDDMESWVYMAVEILKGPLPWGALADHKDMWKWKELVRNEKRDEFFDGLPHEMSAILADIDALKYYEAPNYDLYRRLLKSWAERMQLSLSGPFDWQEQPWMMKRARVIGDLGESHMASGKLISGVDTSIDSQFLVDLTPPDSVQEEDQFCQDRNEI